MSSEANYPESRAICHRLVDIERGPLGHHLDDVIHIRTLCHGANISIVFTTWIPELLIYLLSISQNGIFDFVT